LRDVALAVKAVPDRNFKNIALVREGEDPKPVVRPKIIADVRSESVVYLAEAQRLFGNGADKDALRTFVESEIERVGAKEWIGEERMSPATRKLLQSLKSSLESYAISKLRRGGTTLDEVGTLCADLSKAEYDAFDTPTGSDRLFYGMTAGHDTNYALLQQSDAKRLHAQARELYAALQREHVPHAEELGRSLARAARDANPHFTNVFFDLLDRIL
jgi:hypothetical protein